MFFKPILQLSELAWDRMEVFVNAMLNTDNSLGSEKVKKHDYDHLILNYPSKLIISPKILVASYKDL